MALPTHKIPQGRPGVQTDGLKNHSSPHSGNHLPSDLLTSSSPLLLLLSSSSSSTFCQAPGDPSIPDNQAQVPIGVGPRANAEVATKAAGGLGAQPCTTPSLQSPLFNWRGPWNCPQKVVVGGGDTSFRGPCSNSRRAPTSKPATWQEGQRGDDKCPSCGSMRWEAC